MALPRRGGVAGTLRRRIPRNGALRPSVVSRKAANGFRSEQGAQTCAALRSVASIAKANRRSVLGDLRSAPATASARKAAAPVG